MGARIAIAAVVVVVWGSACVDDPIVRLDDMVNVIDQSSASDLQGAVDLAAPSDLASGDDFAISEDLSMSLDLTSEPDLVVLPDLEPPLPSFNPINEPVGGQVIDADAYDATNIYALGAGYLWKYDGFDWSRRRAFPTGARVAVSRSAPNIVVVASASTNTASDMATPEWKIERSFDNGATFSTLAPLTDEVVPQIAFVPNATADDLWALDGTVLKYWSESSSMWKLRLGSSKETRHFVSTGRSDTYALVANSDGLMRLTNFVFADVTPTALTARFVAVSSGTGMNIDIIGTASSGPVQMLGAVSGGGQWTDCLAPPLPSSVVLFDSTHLAGEEDIIRRRTGVACTTTENWATAIEEKFGGRYGALKPATANATMAIVPSSFGIAMTTNSGTTFSYPEHLLKISEVRGMSRDPADGAIVAATDGGLWFSTDNGMTFVRINAAQHTPLDFAAKRATHWFGASGGLRITSSDGGTTFAAAAQTFGAPSIAADEASAGRFYACDDGLIQVSTNYGVTFATLNPTTGSPPTCSYVATGGGNVWILLPSGGALRSADGGATWNAVGAGLSGGAITQLTVDPTMPTRAYVLQGTLKRISAGGVVDLPISGLSQVRSFAIDPVDDTMIWATGPEGLFLSRNTGASFQRVRSEPGRFVWVNPVNGNNVYFATVADGMFVAR